jgi:hypothetical protein
MKIASLCVLLLVLCGFRAFTEDKVTEFNITKGNPAVKAALHP